MTTAVAQTTQPRDGGGGDMYANAKKKRRRGNSSSSSSKKERTSGKNVDDGNEQRQRPTHQKQERRGGGGLAPSKTSQSKKKTATTTATTNKKAATRTTDGKTLSSSTTNDLPPVPLHKTLLLDDTRLAEDRWYNYFKHQDDANNKNHNNQELAAEWRATTATKPASSELVGMYRRRGAALYEQEVRLYKQQQKSGNNKDDQWVDATIRRGTLKDRIAAMSVSIAAAPIHKMHQLDGLLQMAGCSTTTTTTSASSGVGGGGDGKQQQQQQQQRHHHSGLGNSRVAQLAGEALADLFCNTLVPHHRKLIPLSERPLAKYHHDSSSSSSSKKHYTLSPRILLLWYYEDLVRQTYGNFVRTFLTQILHDGGTAVEPQRVAAVRTAATLLRAIPEQEGTILKLLVNKLGDPIMKKVASCAAHELHRTIALHTNMKTVVAREVQQFLHRPHLADRAVYNALNFLNQLQFSEHRPTDAELARGLIRTYFTLFEHAMAKSSSKSKSKPRKNNTDRGGRGDSVDIQGRLLSALLTGVNRAVPYVGGGGGQTKKDNILAAEHLDALYRVCHIPSSAIPALYLLYEVVSHQRGDNDNNNDHRFGQALYTVLPSVLLSGSGKKKHMTMCFNLLYKVLKYETDTNRLLAVVKKVLSCSLHANASVAAASIFLIKEVAKEQDVLNYCCNEMLNSVDAARYLDATKRDPRYAVRSHGEEEKNDKQDDQNAVKSSTTERKIGLWELSLLQHHYHPTVSKFATFDTIDYTGDPLVDFSVPTFLDKFAYRNPKKQKAAEETTALSEPTNAAAAAAAATATKKRSTKVVQTPVNDAKFWNQDKINVEDAFFQTFFHQRAKRNAIKKQQQDEEEQVEDWGSDEEEEAFVDSLAEGLLKSKASDPVDLDDEDPDMSGWNDMYDGSDDDADENDEDEDAPPATRPTRAMDEDDAFMDADDSSSDDEERPMRDPGDEDEVQHGMDDVDDEADELELLAAAEASDDDDEAPMLVKLHDDGDDAFADADDYADLIAESISSKKQKIIQTTDNTASTKKRNQRNKK